MAFRCITLGAGTSFGGVFFAISGIDSFRALERLRYSDDKFKILVCIALIIALPSLVIGEGST